MVAHAFSPSNQEAKEGRSLGVQGQPALQNAFWDSQGHTEKPSLEKQTKKTKQSNPQVSLLTPDIACLK